MKGDLKKTITLAIIQMLRPLVRILLRNGIPFATFAELAKWVYTDIASNDFSISGRKQTISRVSILTGLSRKEVKKLQGTSVQDDLGSMERYNRAARVISGWLKDPSFQDGKHHPKDLPFEEGEVNFSTLVKAYSGDVPPRAVLDELERVGVVDTNKGRVRLLAKGYIPKRGEIEKLHILGMDVRDLISSIDHNLLSPPSEVYLQRKVSYDNIPKEHLPYLRSMVSKMGEDFIESVDKVISVYDRDVNPSVKGEGRGRLALGVFYFEE
jgi:hypothetical protein